MDLFQDLFYGRENLKLLKENKKSFESDLVIGIYYFKNSNFETSKKYFASAINRKSRSMLDSYMASTLFLWSNLNSERPEVSISNLNKLDVRFENLKRWYIEIAKREFVKKGYDFMGAGEIPKP